MHGRLAAPASCSDCIDLELIRAKEAAGPVDLSKPDAPERLGALRGLFIDCGSRDQYGLHYGARAFVHLRNLGDTEYETWGYWYGENYYTPAAGRNFAVGLDYVF